MAKDRGVEQRIRIAEHYKDWAHESIYRDLISFERHLAELSSVIVLVLESPGAIAELGLFSAIDEFKSKLLIIIETDHYTSPSFIKLGPIDFLEKIHNNFAECHRWTAEVDRKMVFDPKAAQELQPDLAGAVLDRIKKPTSERLYKSDGWLDTALLICDFISLKSALTIREIRGIFEGFGYSKQESEIKQILFILERVGLLVMEPKGEQRFYVSIEPRQFFKFQVLDPSFDIDRYRIDTLLTHERTDKKRFRAILEARRRHAKR